MQKPTIKDVARRAGVAVSTVSLVINNRGRVSLKTRERVLKAIEELRYRPNAVAQRLASSDIRCVAVMVPSIANPFFANIVREIQTAMQLEGYDVMIYSTENDPKVEAVHVEAVVRNRVAGVFIIGEHSPEAGANDARIVDLREDRIPVVLIERQVEGADFISVVADKDSGAYKAAGHLLSLGHQRLAFVGGYLSKGLSNFRLKGFRRAMQDANLDAKQAVIVDSDFTPEGGYRAGQQLLTGEDKVTGILVANDHMCIGLMRALQEAGRRVPQDVSIIGFDNIPETRYLVPALTTVSVPTRQMGKRAARLMLQVLDGQEPVNREWVLDTELILRESTAPPGKTN